MRSPGRRAAPLAAAVALVALWALSSGGPALAHAGLEGAAPEDDETVPRPPREVRLTFNEPVRAEFDPLEVYGPGGGRVDSGEAGTDSDDPAVVAVPLEDGLPAGDYRVEWRVTSADGDPIEGEYRFTARGGTAKGANTGQGGPDGGDAPAEAEGRTGPLPGSGRQALVYGGVGAGAALAVAAVALAVALLRRRRT